MLLYHTEVRWLSRGCIFVRVVELGMKFSNSSSINNPPKPIILKMNILFFILGYLADIFSLLNDLNISMQGRDGDIVLPGEKLSYLQRNCLFGVFVFKAEIWQTFQSLTIFLLEMINHYP